MICEASAFPGRLNTFQRLMLQWGELHPYNGTHTCRIAGPARPEALREAIRATYVQHGIGIAQLAPDGRSYRFETDYEPQVELVPDDPVVARTLDEHVAAELNHAFPRPRCRPLRFSVITGEADTHYVHTTYDHWVADSIASRLILRRVLGRYCQLSIPENELPLQLYPPTYRQVFPQLRGPVKLGQSMVRSMRQWLGRGAIAQPAYTSVAQMAVGHRIFHTNPGTVERLRHFARSLDATVHDVILAALGARVGRVPPPAFHAREPRAVAGNDRRHARQCTARSGRDDGDVPGLFPRALQAGAGESGRSDAADRRRHGPHQKPSAGSSTRC